MRAKEDVLVRVPGVGRYVWEPILGIIDFFEVGQRHAAYTLRCSYTHAEQRYQAIRLCAKHLSGLQRA